MDGIHHTLADLRRGAARLTDAASSATARDIPAVIDQLERALKELSMACYSLATPLASEPVGDRPLPAAERERSLTGLHEIGAAIGSAARVCRTERRSMGET